MEVFKKVFYDPKMGLRSSSSLYIKVKPMYPSITQITKEFLSKQNVGQKFYPLVFKRP